MCVFGRRRASGFGGLVDANVSLLPILDCCCLIGVVIANMKLPLSKHLLSKPCFLASERALFFSVGGKLGKSGILGPICPDRAHVYSTAPAKIRPDRRTSQFDFWPTLLFLGTKRASTLSSHCDCKSHKVAPHCLLMLNNGQRARPLLGSRALLARTVSYAFRRSARTRRKVGLLRMRTRIRNASSSASASANANQSSPKRLS